MRSLKSGLVAIAISGIFGTAAIVGCSADGGGADLGEDTDPTLAAEEAGNSLPPRTDPPQTPADAGKDSGKKDSGPKAEAGFDAGPPPPVPGTACTVDGETKQKTCGACGKQETVCLDTDGTGKKWQEYGVCGSEVANGCIPGTIVDEPCGNCGTQKKTCSQYCAYTTSTCTGQPVNNCKPDTVEYTTAGCSTASTYRQRTCGAACTWNSFSAVCEAPNNPNKLTISTTATGTVAGTYPLSTTLMGPRVSGTCPNASLSSTVDHPYNQVELKNPTTQTAKVSAWLTGTPAIDTVMLAYGTNLPPMSDADKKACKFGSNDYCPSSLPCSTDTDWSGLTGTQQIIIPPGGAVLVQFQSYYPKSNAAEVTTGNATLTVRTDILQ